jgi:hypothetical protein
MNMWVIEELGRQRRLDLLREAEHERLVGPLRRPRAAQRLLQRLLIVMHVDKRAVGGSPVTSGDPAAVAPITQLSVPPARSVECPASA